MSADKATESSSASLAILGGGNVGQALARGWVRSGTLRPDQIRSMSPAGVRTGWRSWSQMASPWGPIIALQSKGLVRY